MFLHRWPILMLAVIPGVVLAQEGKRPLTELSAFGAQMDAGFAAFLGGKSPAEAWPDFATMERQVSDVRAKLAAAGVVRGRVFGIELDVLFLGAEERPLYKLRTYVAFQEGGPVLLMYKGAAAETGAASLTPLPTLTGPLEPIAKAVGGLHAAIREQLALPFADAAELDKAIGNDSARAEVASMLAEARTNEKAVSEAIRALEVVSLQVRLDDVGFLCLDAGGVDRGGFTVEFERRKEGGLALEVGRFRPYPKVDER